jgi:hypothetical protein
MLFKFKVGEFVFENESPTSWRVIVGQQTAIIDFGFFLSPCEAIQVQQLCNEANLCIKDSMFCFEHPEATFSIELRPNLDKIYREKWGLFCSMLSPYTVDGVRVMICQHNDKWIRVKYIDVNNGVHEKTIVDCPFCLNHNNYYIRE